MELKRYGSISRTDNTPYPSTIRKVFGCCFESHFKGTFFGLADGRITINGDIVVNANSVFSIASSGLLIEAERDTNMVIICRHDWHGQNVYGVLVEPNGRLKYIDGCTDSLLIYPPRQGDPCVNHLHFPPGIDQTFHTHPSVRMGLVLRGRGYACLKDGEVSLNAGDIFCVEVDELHRFRTEGEGMDIIAYHPDSDWGPTDEVHPMINRTIINAPA